MKNKNLNFNNKGFILPMVLLVMVILSILFVSINFISSVNTSQIAIQEDNLRAYYLARSAIDIVYAALMEEKDGVLKISKFINDNTISELVDELYLPDKTNPVGIVEITVSKLNDEIKIQSIAKTSEGKGSSKLSLYIDKDNFSNTRWVKE